ncbi:Two-component response regulator, SAPR family, consists of REC, wHTH and BTAD domains [Paenibacillus sp. 1_12]|uniref:response regulator n=1 Tax=Paenibacillus sp. 1_12 TaxID=1566278 RepID=UPI0008EE377B|nr:response regulator [Paenibacillus sp. 1_12]SFL93351.1 Two-component response regulator, SAPR family, consists of REC, wHTH and BTAD domains [Paenibacillus sp. 1_12]
MKAILIDDERPALRQLEQLLQGVEGIQITGKFLSAQEGLDHLAKEQTDVVFLDIGMPEMNGLTAAEYIQQIDSNIRIVYITAYAQYALEAFELHALDYLLKPVDPIRFSKTLNRIRTYFPAKEPVVEKPAVQEPIVFCFQNLTLSTRIDPDGKVKWRTSKTKELFAFLIHHKGNRITKDLLIEEIWPQFAPDKAMIHLHTSIYQIRKIIKQSGLPATLDFSLESYRLNADGLMTDVDIFESSIAQVEAQDTLNESQWRQADLALKLYTGHYLDEQDYSWAKSRRSQLLQRYLSLTLRTAEYELATGRERQAIGRLEKAQEKEPYSEELVELFMIGLAKLNHYTALQNLYESFVNLLRIELDIEPQPQTRERYERLMLDDKL